MEPIGDPFYCLGEQLCLGLERGQWIWAEADRICLGSKWELALDWTSEAGEEGRIPTSVAIWDGQAYWVALFGRESPSHVGCVVLELALN